MLRPGLRAAERVAQQVEQPGRILSHELGDVGARERQQIASGGDRRRHAVGAQPAQRLVEEPIVQNEQLAIGEPAEVARAIDDARIHAAISGAARSARPTRRSRRRTRRSRALLAP